MCGATPGVRACVRACVQREVSSLSCEPLEEALGGSGGTDGAHARMRDAGVVVSLFEVPATAASVKAFIAREHEFRFVAVRPETLDGQDTGRFAVRTLACLHAHMHGSVVPLVAALELMCPCLREPSGAATHD